MYATYVAVNDSDIYVTGTAADRDNQCQVFHYDLITDQWNRLPEPGHRLGVLCIVGEYLAIFGGRNAITDEIHNKVSTYNKDTNGWFVHLPNMIRVRSKPGVVTHDDHVIVIGGGSSPGTVHDSIEIMNYLQRSPWREVSTKLPVPMCLIKPAIAGEHLLIVGYVDATGRSNGSYQISVTSSLHHFIVIIIRSSSWSVAGAVTSSTLFHCYCTILQPSSDHWW